MNRTELFVTPGSELVSGAQMSRDGVYRYHLWRTWDESRPSMVWIMLNPSTADSEIDDPTIRRCISFAKRIDCGGIDVINLYALRATKPKHLLDHPDPEGPHNVGVWKNVLRDHTRPVMAAWGASKPGPLPGSAAATWWLRRPSTAHCLGLTQAGHPRHPLYVSNDTPLLPYRPS